MEVSLIANTTKRKKCRCKPACTVLVQFIDIDGDALKTMCANDARQFSFDILSQLIHSNPNTQKTLRSRRQDWKEDEAELERLYNEGYSYAKIQMILGRTYHSVAHKLERMIKEKKLVPRN